MTRTVAYACAFVPAEWIAAHGLLPRRMLLRRHGAAKGRGVAQGICPFAKAFADALREQSPRPDAAVLTTSCDQMRRMAELLEAEFGESLFLMHVPSTCAGQTPLAIYADEVQRLGDFFAARGGTAPTRETLVATMTQYDDRRQTLRGLRAQLAPVDFARAIAHFHATGLLPEQSPPRKTAGGTPLAIVGGPMMEDHFELFAEIARLGGNIVLDATETGEIALPPPYDRAALARDPLAEMARAYFGTIPSIFKRPNAALFDYLRREMAARGVRGLILHRYLWCDKWHAERARLADLGVPLLDLDTDDADAPARRINRLQAFLETLR